MTFASAIQEVQSCDVETALYEACLEIRLAALTINYNRKYYPEADRLAQKRKLLAYAYLNRACELACAPVHLRPVETGQGVEMAWYSYRVGYFADLEPGERVLCGECYGSGEYFYGHDGYSAITWECPVCNGEGSIPTPVPTRAGYQPIPFFIGYESSMTETEARSRAIG